MMKGCSAGGVDVLITYDGRKEFRSRAARGHEGSSRYVFAQMETLWEISPRRNRKRMFTAGISKTAAKKIRSQTKARAESFHTSHSFSRDGTK